MKILVVDDHNLVRHGFVRLLELVLPLAEISEASDGQEALEMINSISFDLILLDVQMPKMNGTETLARIKAEKPSMKVIMLTQFDETALVSHCLQLGANAFLLKAGNIQDVELAISKVMSEGNYFSPFVVDIIRRRLASSTFADLHITSSEFQILCLLKEGIPTKDIAEKTGLTVYTVDSYRKELLRKTKTKNVAELISLAYRAGIFTTSKKDH
jgi:two-component system response regulator DegU